MNTDSKLKGKVLYDDPFNRFKNGEIGDLVLTNSKKYDYIITFEPILVTEDTPFTDKGELIINRSFYFKNGEVEVLT